MATTQIKIYIAVTLLLASIQLTAHATEHNPYHVLDSLISNNDAMQSAKQRRISAIKQMLDNPALSMSGRYDINDRLYTEYSTFTYDSAYIYACRKIKLADSLGNDTLALISRLDKIHIMAVAGLFDEAERELKTISQQHIKGRVLVNYYDQLNELYLFKSEFAIGTAFYDGYQTKMRQYRKLIIDNAPRNTYTYVSVVADYEAYLNNIDTAIKITLAYLPKLKPGDRRYSMLTSKLAFFYGQKGYKTLQKKYLIESAASDLLGCIREENSMRELASILFDEGDFERAYHYLNVSINNANAYGTRLRSIQTSQLMPKIINGYNLMKEEQHRHTRKLMIGLSITASLLIIALIAVYSLLKRYKQSNIKIDDINMRLKAAITQLESNNKLMREANKIKEEYIGRFMELASTLIDKADDRRRQAFRLIKDHDWTALNDLVKTNALQTEGTQLFYKNFDAAFLRIYPDFVDKVNELMSDDNKIIPKGERLTTELRILALIRLGITDNHKIAGILRSSITTIYTYRSKMKTKSIVKNNFEELVAKIDS